MRFTRSVFVYEPFVLCKYWIMVLFTATTLSSSPLSLFFSLFTQLINLLLRNDTSFYTSWEMTFYINRLTIILFSGLSLHYFFFFFHVGVKYIFHASLTLAWFFFFSLISRYIKLIRIEKKKNMFDRSKQCGRKGYMD